jgi:hypothetical protein
MAAAAVAAHEQEHVRHNADKAASQGLKAYSMVQLQSSICPECGKIYVSGGTTTTFYSEKQQYPGTDNNSRQGSGGVDLFI